MTTVAFTEVPEKENNKRLFQYNSFITLNIYTYAVIVSVPHLSPSLFLFLNLSLCTCLYSIYTVPYRTKTNANTRKRNWVGMFRVLNTISMDSVWRFNFFFLLCMIESYKVKRSKKKETICITYMFVYIVEFMYNINTYLNVGANSKSFAFFWNETSEWCIHFLRILK